MCYVYIIYIPYIYESIEPCNVPRSFYLLCYQRLCTDSLPASPAACAWSQHPGHSGMAQLSRRPGHRSAPAGAERALCAGKALLWTSGLQRSPKTRKGPNQRARRRGQRPPPHEPLGHQQGLRLSLHVPSSDMGKLYIRPPLYLLRGFLWFKLSKRQSLKWFYFRFPDTCGF